MGDPGLFERWQDDERVLVELGVALQPQDTTCRVRIPRELAQQAVWAWDRRGEEIDLPDETPEEVVVRERAAALALIGSQLAGQSGWGPEAVEATLDAWFIGVALGAADDHDALDSGPGEEQAGGTVASSAGNLEGATTTGDLGFSLWLEFEHLDEDVDDFANVGITLPDGSAYSLNVWTFAFVADLAARVPGDDEALRIGYTRPPDLLVRELSRPQITAAVRHLLTNGGLPASSLLPAE